MKYDEALAALSKARDDLVSAGFNVVAERGPDRDVFGDRMTELERGPCRVLLILDRGQPFVTMRAPRAGRDYGLDLWEACLDGREPVLEERGFDADVQLLLHRLSEFEQLAAEGGEALDECLPRSGRWRFFARRERGLIRYPADE